MGVLRSLQQQTDGVSFVRSLYIIVNHCNTLAKNRQHYISDNKEVYDAYYTVTSLVGNNESTAVNVPLLTRSMVEFWMMIEAFKGNTVQLESVFPFEYATNLKKMDDKVVLTSTKYLCLAYPRDECLLNGWSSECPVADGNVIDFFWNVLYLRLKTPQDIVRFVSSVEDGYLLTDDEQRALIEQGKHEIFEQTALEETRNALKEILTALRTICPAAASATPPPPAVTYVQLVPLVAPPPSHVQMAQLAPFTSPPPTMADDVPPLPLNEFDHLDDLDDLDELMRDFM